MVPAITTAPAVFGEPPRPQSGSTSGMCSLASTSLRYVAEYSGQVFHRPPQLEPARYNEFRSLVAAAFPSRIDRRKARSMSLGIFDAK
jgi:hypothetical protein